MDLTRVTERERDERNSEKAREQNIARDDAKTLCESIKNRGSVLLVSCAGERLARGGEFVRRPKTYHSFLAEALLPLSVGQRDFVVFWRRHFCQRATFGSRCTEFWDEG